MKSATMLVCTAALLLAGVGCDDDDDDIDLDRDDAGFVFDGGAPGEDAGELPDAAVADAAVPDGAMMGERLPTAFCCAEQTRSAGGMTGMTFELNCPVGNVVTGWQGTADTNRVWSMSLLCASLDAMEMPDGTIDIRTGWASGSAVVGNEDMGEMVTSRCAVNQFGRGVYGKADDEVVYSAGLLCGQGFANGDRDIEVTPGSNSDFFGGSAGTGFDIQCPEDTIMTGLTGRATQDMGITRLSAVCAQATITD